jgi:hypothetical protein
MPLRDKEAVDSMSIKFRRTLLHGISFTLPKQIMKLLKVLKHFILKFEIPVQ